MAIGAGQVAAHIVVDTSALMAILLNEPESDACIRALDTDAPVLMCAGTVAEALIVAERRGLGTEMTTLIDNLGFDIIPVTRRVAHNVAAAYAKWGKGVHPAALNFGDCFAYAIAKEANAMLLYVGDDFSKTDLVSAIAS